MKKFVIAAAKKYGKRMFWEEDRELEIGDWRIYVYGDGLGDYDVELTYGKYYPEVGNHYWWKNCPRKKEVVELIKKKYGESL